MTEDEFRQKYPHSSEEQVRLYGEAVALEAAGVKPTPEPDIPMPIITVPERQIPTRTVPDNIPQITATTYVASGMGYTLRNFSLDDVPPEMPSAGAAEMRDILLGPFAAHLSPEQRQLFQSDVSADDMLAAFFDPKWTPGGLGPN
jgi:hypothetical protein